MTADQRRAPRVRTRALGRMIAILTSIGLSRGAHAQGTLTLTAGSTSAGTIATPLRAQYESATKESLATSSWTLANSCDNGGACITAAALSAAAGQVLTSVKLTIVVPNNNNCQTAAGTFSVTINSTAPVDLFMTKKNQSCQVTVTSFVVNDMSYTRYVSNATTNLLYTQGIVFSRHY